MIAAALPHLSRSRVQRLIGSGAVSVDGLTVKKSTLLQAGQLVSVELSNDGPSLGRAPGAQLAVLYEDESLLLVDKPIGVTAHAAPGDDSPTVAAWFALHHPDLVARLDRERPGIVHRLDKDTTGVLALGKTPEAVAALAAAFEERTVHKTYLAICYGVPSPAEAIIDAPIARHPADRSRMGVVRDGSGREARTRYELLGGDGDRSLLRVEPESGRTHQVRVHLAAVGVPVLFDSTYGTAGDGRHQLHAWRLELPHPQGGLLAVTAPMPRDMSAIVRSMGLQELASEYETSYPPLRSPE
jgi:23S rRNA pseudouridine1911/1915/1917 synthase